MTGQHPDQLPGRNRRAGVPLAAGRSEKLVSDALDALRAGQLGLAEELLDRTLITLGEALDRYESAMTALTARRRANPQPRHCTE